MRQSERQSLRANGSVGDNEPPIDPFAERSLIGRLAPIVNIPSPSAYALAFLIRDEMLLDMSQALSESGATMLRWKHPPPTSFSAVSDGGTRR